MDKARAAPGKFRRCFISGAHEASHAWLVGALAERGIEATSAESLSTGKRITQEILRLIANSDFLLVVLDEGERSDAIYELGVARGLGKPAFVILTAGRFTIDVSGVYLRAVEGPGRISDAAEDLDRFLRNAKRPDAVDESPSEEGPVDLGWARQALRDLRADPAGSRGSQFEALVQRIFDAAGAEVVSTEAGSDEGVDLVVWMDQLAAQTDGPFLVECKLFKGGSGSVIKNTEALVRRLARTVEGTDCGVALLVYDHDRPRTPPSLYETPKVLSFAVDDLIEDLERGRFAREVLRRRERAAFRLGLSG